MMVYEESDDVTKITLSEIPGKYGHTTYHIELLTYFDVGIAYVRRGIVINTYDDYGGTQTYLNDVYDEKDSKIKQTQRDFISKIQIDYIDEIRFMDGPQPIETFILTRKIFNKILCKDTIDLMNTKCNLPSDICDKILDLTETIPSPVKWEGAYITWENEDDDPEDPTWPMIVQSHKRGRKDAHFCVVERNTPDCDVWKKMNYRPDDNEDNDDNDDELI
jgi:hypothetical protein